MNRLCKTIIYSWVFVVLSGSICQAARIKGSPHDLTTLAPGEICNFCHTPHGTERVQPLWNHKFSSAVYKVYQSSSLDAKPGQPTGSSKLCLSCHDGTVALNHRRKRRTGGSVFITPGTSNLGTDLSDDHPISFVYSNSLVGKDPQIRPPSSLPPKLSLDKFGELQCTTCHEPHNNEYGNFLVMSNQGSAMCVSCHNLTGWEESVHQSSGASVRNATDPYLRKSQYVSMADNGCNCCHRSHSAGGKERLLHFEKSEANCLNCHTGTVAETNLRTPMSNFSSHNVMRYDKIHDLKESPLSSKRHVECVDCHNPHSIEDSKSDPPLAGGMIKNVSGVTASGSAIYNIEFEYELCFKCHGDNPDRVPSDITRVITQTNTRLEFQPDNPSFHPVTSSGINENVPSLIAPLTIADMIRCTDCHNAEAASSVRGPHGSIYAPILAYNYETTDFTVESESAYELCYKCHSRNSILDDQSFPEHRLHLVDNDIPCSACHDAHGISSVQGNETNNSHLINFDVNIVERDPSSGLLEFQDDGLFQGQCYLTCHGVNHSPKTY